MKTSCLTCPNSARGHDRPVHGGSDQRHGSWWTTETVGDALGERGHCDRNDAQAGKPGRSGIDRDRKRPGQRMEGTALIVQVEDAVMVVGIGGRDGALDVNVRVSGDRGGFEHIEGMIVDHGNDARDLGGYE